MVVYFENEVEVETHLSVIISEKLTILRVGSVGMNFKCVEVVCNIGD